MPQPRSNPGLSNAQYAKLLIFTNALIPLALLLYDIDRDQTGPDEVSFILHTTGLMALICLLASLAITPLRKLTGNSFFMHFRRMLGLFAFFYAGLHLLAYLEYRCGWRLPRRPARRGYDPLHLLRPRRVYPDDPPGSDQHRRCVPVKQLDDADGSLLHRWSISRIICTPSCSYLLVKRDERLHI